MTPPEVRVQRAREKEMEKMDRDMRTIFAYNLALRAEEQDLFGFFVAAGPLNDIKIIRDRASGRSKGVAYVEYQRKEDVMAALALTGRPLLGQAVMVKMSEAEKNLAWEAAEAQKAQAKDMEARAWVHFRHLTDATRAMQSLDRFTLVDREIRVTLDAAGLLGAAAVAGTQPPQPPQPSAVGAALNEPLDTAGAEDGGGLRLTSAGRTALMTALAANTGMQVPSMQLPLKVPAPTAPAIPEAVRLDQGLLGPASPIPTQCVLLKNMFDPEEESEPGWSEDIAADVGEECAKFGELQHLHVDAASKGFVYLKFVAVPAAAAAVQAMNGRWFAGKQVAAVFQFAAMYNAHFGL
ncbi:RNA-binding protein 39 [Auxenochlorella protothecoides]|nr:RNA-binding protein 39 [Auxenochlorella protothecoides]KFM28198.1 RNA-binding protein 39 [Auxenochlorella protothecoides]